MTRRHVIWNDLTGPGMQHVTLTEDAEGCLVDGMYIGRNDDTTPYRLHYRIRIDPQWRMTDARLTLMDGSGGSGELTLAVYGNSEWQDGEGAPLAQLAGCHEIDISASPLTKTLAIRRLDLAAGESAEISVAYIDVPQLTVRPVRQRYGCIRPFDAGVGLYRYEALFRSGSAVELAVDENGLVIEFPGSFRRVWPEEPELGEGTAGQDR